MCAPAHDITMGDSALHSPPGAQGATEWEKIRPNIMPGLNPPHQLVQFPALLLAGSQLPVNQASEALMTSSVLY